MTEDQRLKTSRTIGEILAKLRRGHGSRSKTLDKGKNCLLHCPHKGCEECLIYTEDDKRIEVPLVQSFDIGSERVHFYCPFCRKMIPHLSFDPEKVYRNRRLERGIAWSLSRRRRS